MTMREIARLCMEFYLWNVKQLAHPSTYAYSALGGAIYLGGRTVVVDPEWPQVDNVAKWRLLARKAGIGAISGAIAYPVACLTWPILVPYYASK